MQMKTGVVICARVESHRLPNKILRRIGKITLIEALLKNVIQGNPLQVVLAIPKSESNNIIEGVVRDAKIPVEIYRGEDESPAHRILAVAKKHNWDYVVRLTHDNPLIDIRILNKQVKFSIERGLDYCYITKMPVGTYGEVIKVSVLESVIKDSKETEYLSYLLRRNGIKSLEFIPPSEYRYKARLTVDYSEDLQLLRIIDHCLAPGYTLLSVINFLEQNKYLLNINKQPDISVLITNYNYSDFVVSAIASVAAQTELNWECLIYDDSSTDRSLNKIVTYLSALDGVVSRKFKVCSFPENNGLGAMCNRALKAVRGKYYIRLDSDDVLRNDALQQMKYMLDHNDKIEGVWSGYQYLGGEKNGENMLPDNPQYEYHPACCLLRTDTVLSTGYREKYKFYEGADFLDNFRKIYNVGKIDQSLWLRRIHEGQMTDIKTKKEREKVIKELSKEGITINAESC